MGNQDLLNKVKMYAADLERELRGAIDDKVTWENVSRGTHQALGAYAGLAVITIQEQMGLQEAEYSIQIYGKVLMKLCVAFPEIKSLDTFYEQFPHLRPEGKNE